MAAKNKWRAEYYFEGQNHHLGLYDTAEDAALAYNEEAIRRWGKHAWLNRIGEPGV